MKSFSLLSILAWRRNYLINRKMKNFCCALIVGLLGTTSLWASADKISADLANAIEHTSEALPVVVMMKGYALVPQAFAMQLPSDDLEKMMKQRAMQLQEGMRDYVRDLAGEPGVMNSGAPITRYKFFWNVNAMMATATPEVIAEMADREDVQRIILDRRIKLDRDYREIEELDGTSFTYGLEKIGVPELRTKHPEVNGKGVVVGIIDTGLDASHPEFKGKQVVFKDFVNNRTASYDDNGHGTHVAGTISGIGANGTQIGIAPEVSLVIAKVFTSQGSGSLSAILRAMEWMGNPGVAEGGSKLKPRVVNNSWGGGTSDSVNDDPFYQATLTWVQLEIFPCFAAGNAGPSPSTLGSPGRLPPAFAVGATDSEDQIARFSSRGPVEIGMDGKRIEYVKPDVSAPGVQVLSAMPGGKYGKLSGTSMATPHTTGVIALLYQAKPNLKVAQIRELLEKTSQDLGESGKDNNFGSGRINVTSAIDQMEAMGISLFDR